MHSWGERIDSVAEQTGFSGVVSVHRGAEVEFAQAYGLAHRAHRLPNTVDTRFAIASGTKGVTAVTVASLIAADQLALSTTARTALGPDLPLLDDGVTVEHLLAHRSGMGDYIDEADFDPNAYVLPVPVHELASTEQYLPVLAGHPMIFSPGERFSYCNSGYVVLALIAERVSGIPFAELVHDRVCVPAAMGDTHFFRSDELPERTAYGYLQLDNGLRTNVFHLPVKGSGDGGLYSTAADLHKFWTSLFAARILPAGWVAELLRRRSDVPSNQARYGLGFWLHEVNPNVILEGYDAGVSFRSVHDPVSDRTHTVLSNTSDGAWPLARLLDETFASDSG